MGAPRIRTVKPALFRHHKLWCLEQATAMPMIRAFAALFCVADREGRFKWEPVELKLDCCPYDNLDFADLLEHLRTHGFIARYAVDRKVYGLIPGFLEHQVIPHREAKSSIPAPPSGCNEISHRLDCGCTATALQLQCTFTALPGNCTVDALQLSGGREGKGRERKGSVISDDDPSLEAPPLLSSDSEEEDEEEPPHSKGLSTEDEESAKALVRSFREDYRDTVDEAFEFGRAIPAAEIKAAHRFLTSQGWSKERHQALKEYVLTDKCEPTPTNNWRGEQHAVRSLAKMWKRRSDLEAGARLKASR